MKFQLFKALLPFSLPNKFGIFLKGLVQGFSNLRKLFNESSVEACMTKELPNCFHICWGRQFGNKFDLCFINFYSPAGNNVPQYDSLVNHKMAFLLVKHQVLLYAPLQDGFQIGQTFFKITSIYCDVIHVYLHYTLHHIAEHTEHTSLKSGWGVAKAKMHPPISIRAKWTSESGLFLIL